MNTSDMRSFAQQQHAYEWNVQTCRYIQQKSSSYKLAPFWIMQRQVLPCRVWQL